MRQPNFLNKPLFWSVPTNYRTLVTHSTFRDCVLVIRLVYECALNVLYLCYVVLYWPKWFVYDCLLLVRKWCALKQNFAFQMSNLIIRPLPEGGLFKFLPCIFDKYNNFLPKKRPFIFMFCPLNNQNSSFLHCQVDLWAY